MVVIPSALFFLSSKVVIMYLELLVLIMQTIILIALVVLARICKRISRDSEESYFLVVVKTTWNNWGRTYTHQLVMGVEGASGDSIMDSVNNAVYDELTKLGYEQHIPIIKKDGIFRIMSLTPISKKHFQKKNKK